MACDGGAFVSGQLKTDTLKDVNAALPVPAAVTLGGLSKVVEQTCDSDAVGRKAVGVGEHVLVNLKGMPSKAAVLLMVAVAAALKVAGCLQIVDNGFNAGALCGAEDRDDPVLDIVHVCHMLDIFTSRNCVSFSRGPQ